MELEDLQSKRGKKGRFHAKSYHIDLSSNNQSKEVVFKVASDLKGNKSGSSSVKNSKSLKQCIDYITRNAEKFEEDFIRPVDEMGNELSHEETEEVKKDWGEEFENEKRKNARLATHFVLSVDEKPTDKNIQRFNDAKNDFLRERFGDDGFRCISVTHTDNGKIHAHIVVNNYNKITKKKLRMDKNWFLESRIMAKEKLNEHGFNYKATLKQDRKKQVDINKEGESKQEVKGSVLVAHGEAPYEFQEDNKESYFVTLDNGSTIWGVRLEDAISESGAKIGDKISIAQAGAESVEVENEEGVKISSLRNEWHIEVIESNQPSKEPAKDWFEARLRKAARNNEHYQKLLEWKQLIDVARESYHDSKELREARAQLSSIDNFSKGRVNEAAFLKVLRNSDITSEKVDEVRSSTKKRSEQNEKRLNRQVYSAAYELVKTEVAIELSKDLSHEDKQEMLKAVDQRKKDIDPFNKINFNGLKHKVTSEINYSRDLQKHLKEVHKLSKSKEPTEKAVLRTFRQTQSARDLSKPEKEIFDRELSKTLVEVDKKGVPAFSLHRKWQQQQTISEHIKALPDRFDNLGNKQSQKLINALSEQIDKNATSKRDEIRLSKSLEATQLRLDTKTQSDRGSVAKDVSRQLYSLKTLDSKKDKGRNDLYARQLFAMTKTHLSLKARLSELPNHDQQSLSDKVAKLEVELIKRGADLERTRLKQTVTLQINDRHQRAKETLKMEHIPAKELMKAIDDVNNSKAIIKESDLTVTKQRETNSSLNVTRDKAIEVKAQRLAQLERNLSKLEQLSKQARSLSSSTGLSPTQKIQNRNQLNNMSKLFDKTALEVKKDLPLVGGQRRQLEVTRQITNLQQQFTQGRTRSR